MRGALPPARMDPLPTTDADWRARLTPERYAILRGKGTEPPYTGRYWDCHDDGTYHCAGCGAALFDSRAKFDSRTGWPSFDSPAVADAIETRSDWSWLGRRTEVVCRRCGGHLGHVFGDGPRARGGRRYCINSAALDLQPPAPG